MEQESELARAHLNDLQRQSELANARELVRALERVVADQEEGLRRSELERDRMRALLTKAEAEFTRLRNQMISRNLAVIQGAQHQQGKSKQQKQRPWVEADARQLAASAHSRSQQRRALDESVFKVRMSRLELEQARVRLQKALHLVEELESTEGTGNMRY